MTRVQVGRWLRDTGGVSLVELLVAAAVFMFVVFGVGSLYLSARRGFDFGSAEAFVQRQGTLLQERVTRDLQSATSLQVVRCGGAPADSGRSILYTLAFPGRPTNPVETWCIYWQGPAPSGALWRCTADPSTIPPPCTSGVENLLPPVPDSVVAGQLVEITDMTGKTPPWNFNPAGVMCGATPAPCGPTAVDVVFEMDLHPPSSGVSLLYGVKRFGFTVAVRN